MKSVEERIADCLSYLESIRDGYKYSMSISKTNFGITHVSVVGESLKDKSYPHTFLSVKLEDFSKLPEAIMVEADKIIQDEITSKQKSIASLQTDIDKLLAKGELLVALKGKLNENKN